MGARLPGPFGPPTDRFGDRSDSAIWFEIWKPKDFRLKSSPVLLKIPSFQRVDPESAKCSSELGWNDISVVLV